MRVFMLFFTRSGTVRLPPTGRFMCMDIDGRAIALLGRFIPTGPVRSVAATDGRCMAGIDALTGGDLGPDGPGFGFAATSAGGRTDFGPGFATGIVGCRGAVIAAAILADGETITGAAASAGTGAFIACEDSCMPEGGGAGFGPVSFEERGMPATGGTGAFVVDRAGAGLFACGRRVLVLGLETSIEPGGGGGGFGPVDASTEVPAAGGGGGGRSITFFLGALLPSCGGFLGRTLSASDMSSGDGRSAVDGRSIVACS